MSPAIYAGDIRCQGVTMKLKKNSLNNFDMKKKISLGLGIIALIVAGAVYMIKNSSFFLTQPTTSIEQQTDRTGRSMNGKGRGGTKTEVGRGIQECTDGVCASTSGTQSQQNVTAEVKNALDKAINDEYKARETYAAVIASFGSVRPFSNIIQAEDNHISSLVSLYEQYGLDVLENEWSGKVIPPKSIAEACSIGVQAEIENGLLYKNELIPAVLGYDDITQVFTNLMDASEQKHLPAFQRCAE